MDGPIRADERRSECIDNKKTCFGCSLDGDSAFEVVDREIMVRELFFAGEEGDIWQYSNNNYTNTKCHIKRNGEISRAFEEELGVRQGVPRSSDHYKTYVSPCLDTIDASRLGYWIGPICVSVAPVADDVYLLSDKPDKLQQLMFLAGHYGDRYRIKYGANKTKITVTGSKIDMDYYESVTPWKMDGKTVEVVKNNEHLGLVVSGERSEEKNINIRLVKGRGSLFGLLGPAFAQRCLLNPELKMHLFRMYTCQRRSNLKFFWSQSRAFWL